MDKIAELKAETSKQLKRIKEDHDLFETYIKKFKQLSLQYPGYFEIIRELEIQNAKNKSILEKYAKDLEYKKNCKFQTKCIQISKEILKEEPKIEYRPPFLNGLEFDAFFQKYRIALEAQGSQH